MHRQVEKKNQQSDGGGNDVSSSTGCCIVGALSGRGLEIKGRQSYKAVYSNLFLLFSPAFMLLIF